jgi:hypothetical protein
LIQKLFYFQRFRDLIRGARRRLDFVVLQDRVAYSNAFIADVSTRVVAGGGNQLSNYILAFVAKRTP